MWVHNEGVRREQSAHWALGFLSDGQCEMLGVWLPAVTGGQGWSEVFDDLGIRGVERIRLVVSSDPAGADAAPWKAYPSAVALPSFGQLLGWSLAQAAPRDRGPLANALAPLVAADTSQAAQAALTSMADSRLGTRYPAVAEGWRAALVQLEPYYTLAPRLRRMVLLGDGAVQRLHRRLGQAVGRCGDFPDRDAAASWLAGALRRAERALEAGCPGVAEVTEHNFQRSGVRSTMKTSGL